MRKFFGCLLHNPERRSVRDNRDINSFFYNCTNARIKFMPIPQPKFVLRCDI